MKFKRKKENVNETLLCTHSMTDRGSFLVSSSFFFTFSALRTHAGYQAFRKTRFIKVKYRNSIIWVRIGFGFIKIDTFVLCHTEAQLIVQESLH